MPLIMGGGRAAVSRRKREQRRLGVAWRGTGQRSHRVLYSSDEKQRHCTVHVIGSCHCRILLSSTNVYVSFGRI